MKIQNILENIARELKKITRTQNKIKKGLINKGILPAEVGVPE